jgi:hypothetical protein
MRIDPFDRVRNRDISTLFLQANVVARPAALTYGDDNEAISMLNEHKRMLVKDALIGTALA